MRKKNFILLFLLVVFAGFFMKNTAYAAEGSITVTTEAKEKVVLYKIADEDGFTDEWKECPVSLEELGNKETAKVLADYAKKNSVEGIAKVRDEDDIVTFMHLGKGVYLIVQDGVINPYIVFVPMMVDGKEEYDIHTFPKVEPDEPDTPEDDKSKVPVAPGISMDPEVTLPQTGQLNWPVPVLAISGIILFTLGWYLCYREKER